MDAIAREEAIKTLHSYTLFLNLHLREKFEGLVDIKASFSKSLMEMPNGNKKNIFLDFHGESVKWIMINGEMQ